MGRVSEVPGQLAVDCNTTRSETIDCGTLLALPFRYRDTPYCSFGTRCSRWYSFPCQISCFERQQSTSLIKHQLGTNHTYRTISTDQHMICCVFTHKNTTTSKLFVGKTFWQKACLKPSCPDCGTVTLTNCVRRDNEGSGACRHREDNASPVAADCRSLGYGVTNKEVGVTPLHGAEAEYCAVTPSPFPTP
jgi:hypothetical protein